MNGAAWRAFFDALGENERVTVSIQRTKYEGAVDSIGTAEVAGRDVDYVVLVDHHGTCLWVPLEAITAVEVEW